MGKQSRKKHRQKNRNKHCPTAGSVATTDVGGAGNADEAASSLAVVGTPAGRVVARVRHGDPKVRHGALAALSSTLFAPSSLTTSASSETKAKNAAAMSSTTTTIIDETLLRAVAERILDDDVPAATCAAGCMGNYLAFYGVDGGGGGGGDEDLERVLGVGLGDAVAAVLIRRAERECGEVRTLTAQMVGVTRGANDDNGDGEEDGGPTPRLKDMDAQMEVVAADAKESGGSGGGHHSKKKKKKTKAKGGNNKPSSPDRLRRALDQAHALLSLCLSALCSLVERCPRSLDRLSDDATSGGGRGENALLRTLLGVLSLPRAVAADPARVAAAAGEAKGEWEEHGEDAAGDSLVYAARALHASLDENPPLAAALLELSDPTAGGGGAALVSSFASLPSSSKEAAAGTASAGEGSASEAAPVPPAARLHCAGALVTLRHLGPRALSSENDPSAATDAELRRMDALLADSVLPLLRAQLTFDAAAAATLLRTLAAAEEAATREAEDETVEKDVIRACAVRGESSKSIAKRQKAIKAERERKKKAEESKKAEAAAASVEAMEEEDGKQAAADGADETAREDSGGKAPGSAGRVDTDAARRRALRAWHEGYLLPVKLAAEVTANLCAGSSPAAPGDDDGPFERTPGAAGDDDEMMWDSDDEARWQAENAAARGQGDQRGDGGVPPRDAELFDAVVRSGVPDGLVDLLRSVASFVCGGNGDLTAAAAEDLSDLLSTAGATLGNALANLPAWAADGTDAARALWKVASECCAAASSSASGDDAPLAAACAAACAAAMVAILQHRPSVIPSVGEDDLRSILALLEFGAPVEASAQHSSSSSPSEAAAEARRDAASMLGLLTSRPHPPSINDAVCAALLAALGRADAERPAVTCQVLEVLMDLYAADDDDPGESHGEVFRRRDVLGQFEGGSKAFKRRIKAKERSGRAVEEETEVWRECALNAGRFVRYKKGQAL